MLLSLDFTLASSIASSIPHTLLSLPLTQVFQHCPRLQSHNFLTMNVESNFSLSRLWRCQYDKLTPLLFVEDIMSTVSTIDVCFLHCVHDRFGMWVWVCASSHWWATTIGCEVLWCTLVASTSSRPPTTRLFEFGTLRTSVAKRLLMLTLISVHP